LADLSATFSPTCVHDLLNLQQLTKLELCYSEWTVQDVVRLTSLTKLSHLHIFDDKFIQKHHETVIADAFKEALGRRLTVYVFNSY